MRTRKVLLAVAVAVGIASTAVDAATAQGMSGRMGPSMMQGGTDQEMMDHGIMRGGQNMEQCMMHGMGSGMMGQHMGRGMMMGSGMMGSGMMQGGTRSGMGGLFGSRVTPTMNLSIEDVRGYLTLRLERLNNKRLKLGELKSDDKAITADIVTVDNSLVQRLKVDRHTGAIEYEN
jgi:hypothetical protein